MDGSLLPAMVSTNVVKARTLSSGSAAAFSLIAVAARAVESNPPLMKMDSSFTRILSRTDKSSNSLKRTR